MTITTLIVGMHFRPPAKALLANLPSGAELALVPERDNPYDELAIKVMVQPSEVPESRREQCDLDCSGQGYDFWELLAAGEALQLGYVIASSNKVAKSEGLPGNAEVWQAKGEGWGGGPAKLGFDPQGRPQVIIQTGAA